MLEDRARSVILLVDPLEMRRACLHSALSSWAEDLDFELMATTPLGSLPSAGTAAVRLVVINLGSAGVSSLGTDLLLSEELAPHAIISDRADPQEAVEAAERGYQGFLPASLSLEIVKQALAFIMGGGTYFPREALLSHPSSRAQNNGHGKSSATETLTTRQNEVLCRLRFGISNKHIARELNMQEATVKVHVRQIMRKFGAANRTQVALLAQSGEGESAESTARTVLPQVIHSKTTSTEFNGARHSEAI